MPAGGGAIPLGGLAGELELLLQGQHWLGVAEQQPAGAPGEGGVAEVEGRVHLAALVQLLQLIKQGVELLLEAALLALDGNDGLQQAVDRLLALAQRRDQSIGRARTRWTGRGGRNGRSRQLRNRSHRAASGS